MRRRPAPADGRSRSSRFRWHPARPMTAAGCRGRVRRRPVRPGRPRTPGPGTVPIGAGSSAGSGRGAVWRAGPGPRPAPGRSAGAAGRPSRCGLVCAGRGSDRDPARLRPRLWGLGRERRVWARHGEAGCGCRRGPCGRSPGVGGPVSPPGCRVRGERAGLGHVIKARLAGGGRRSVGTLGDGLGRGPPGGGRPGP